MTDNTERNMIRVLIVSAILVAIGYGVTACGDEDNGAGLPHGCDVCRNVVADAGTDAR